MAARQRFYEVLTSASVPDPDAVRVHVGLAGLLSVSYRFDLALRGLATDSGVSRKRNSAGGPQGGPAVQDAAPRDWLPDHLHYNYLFQHAPADLACQLELASAAAKAELPELQLFSGYSRLNFSREQLLELMELMGRMYPKMMEGLRTFLPASEALPEQEAQLASFG